MLLIYLSIAAVSIYVEQEDMREAVDITELNAEIECIVARSDVLRREISAIVAEIEGQAKGHIKMSWLISTLNHVAINLNIVVTARQ